MENKDILQRIEKFTVNDEKLAATLASYTAIVLIFINLTIVNSTILGVVSSLTFFLINATFLGQAFFKKENTFLRFALGIFLLIAFIGIVSWATMIIYNLDAFRSTTALFIVATVCFIIKKLRTNLLDAAEQESSASNSHNLRLHVSKVLYLILIALLLYLLLLARSDEVYTVWQFMSPMFIPLFFVTSFLLIIIIFSSERTEHKLMLIIIHSILTHSFFFIAFPAGDIGGQQMMLGRTRLVFDNVIFNGWPPSPPITFLEQIYSWFRPTNFQMALSVVLARMLAVDVLWVHLLLVPILWGVFIPIAIFLITQLFIRNENISVLSSLLISLFPWSTYWGAISVPNSLGYIFFSYSIIFLIKYLRSNDRKTISLMITFSLASFLGHFLTGIIAFCLLLLAITFRRYQIENNSSPKAAKASLASSFLFCTSLLPLALLYVRFFYPFYTYFSLATFSEYSSSEIIWALIFGEYPVLDFSTALIHAMGPLLGIAGILYVISRYSKQVSTNEHRITLFFMLTGLLMIAIDYRILKFFMTGLPFAVGRLWMFQYFIAIPFIGIVVYDVITFLHRKASKALSQLFSSAKTHQASLNTKTVRTTVTVGILIVTYVSTLFFLPAWITLAVYRAYPHYSPLQITSYELESVRYIDTNTTEKYVVIGDIWILFAGHMIVGINNPNAFYFSSTDPHGVTLFIYMKTNPTNETLIEAMKYNNATVAYFIIEKLRLGADLYNRIIAQAKQNGLQVYKIFYYPEAEEKLRIFYHKKPFNIP